MESSKKTLIGILAIAGLLAGNAVLAQDVVLDNFNQDQDEVVDPGTNSSTLANVPVAGASREISVSRTGGSNAVRARVAEGRFQYSQDTGVTGRGEIDWTSLPNLDLSFRDTIVLRIASSDFSAPVTITISSPGGQSTLTQNTPPLAMNAELAYDFSGVGNADFGNVTGINLEVNGSGVQDLDLQLDELLARGPGACEFDPSLPADSPDCEEPVCPFDPSLPPDDPACVPPPPVPGISGVGLTVALLGLPLIAGLLGGIRRRR